MCLGGAIVERRRVHDRIVWVHITEVLTDEGLKIVDGEYVCSELPVEAFLFGHSLVRFSELGDHLSNAKIHSVATGWVLVLATRI